MSNGDCKKRVRHIPCVKPIVASTMAEVNKLKRMLFFEDVKAIGLQVGVGRNGEGKAHTFVGWYL